MEPKIRFWGSYTERQLKNFWRRVEKTPGCWLWRGTIVRGGYGHVSINDETIKAHRVSWEIHKGAIPEGLRVLHHCDVRCCVRPEHLFLGTAAANSKNMVLKGRHRNGNGKGAAKGLRSGAYTKPWRRPRGERHGNSKLTCEIVKEIRTRLATGESQESIAKDVRVCQTAVSAVHRRKTWNHVE